MSETTMHSNAYKSPAKHPILWSGGMRAIPGLAGATCHLALQEYEPERINSKRLRGACDMSIHSRDSSSTCFASKSVRTL